MAEERKLPLRCAVYTRKSSEEGLEQAFNSLDAQREACEAYILSQKHEGWSVISTKYDDGGFSGGNVNRPALTQLMADIAAGKVDLVVVYKVDRLSRALSDFARMVEAFDANKVSFVSVTQPFNTTTSMGRLTLNVLLSFAQFEREVTGERIRDKIAASKRKGMWMGGPTPVGYTVQDRKLIPESAEVEQVREIYRRFLALGCVSKLKKSLDDDGIISKVRINKNQQRSGGLPYSRGALYELLRNALYIGDTVHKGERFPGEHEGIVPVALWEGVQEKLNANINGVRSGVQSKEANLLTGLAYTADGQRLTPSYTNKKGKRYRYYVAQNREPGTGAKIRVPAQDLEQVVVDRIVAFLTSGMPLLDALVAGAEAQVQQRIGLAGQRVASRLAPAGAECQAFLQKVVARLMVQEDGLEIVLTRAGLLKGLGEEVAEPAEEKEEHPDDIVLAVRARLMRCGMEVRLMLPGDPAIEKRLAPNIGLVKAVARGRSWYEYLISRDGALLADLAATSGVDGRYASRILRGGFVAPDIVDAILEGRQPAGLTLDRLVEELPLDWGKQREVLGF